jgi:hypothetical protein
MTQRRAAGLILALPILLLACGVYLAGASAQIGVIGRGIPQGTPVVIPPPCDLVSGCVATYSAQRRMLATYTGNLFQLTKTGGATQDIGQTSSGRVDMTAIATFCGTTSGTGRSTTTTNNCRVTLIYDHSGNGNTLTALTTGSCPTFICSVPCPLPYAVNTAGKPIFVNASDNTCFLGNQAPTGTPNGNAAISIYVAANDQIWSTEDNPYAYGLDFGMHHGFAVADVGGISYALNLRGGFSSSLTSTPFLSFGLDIEQDSAELYYGFGDYTAAEKALSPNVHDFGSVGDFTGTSSYDPGTTNIVLDFQNGTRTYTHTYGSMNIGGGSPAEIREGYTGDGTASLQGAWYEGAIYAAALSLAQQHQLQANGRTFYSITAQPTCASGGVDLIGGSSVVTGGWGLRELDPTLHGPVAIIDRVSDSALMVLGTTSGNCNLDLSAAATFCAATTCHAWTLYNQVVSVSGYIGVWTGRVDDLTRFTSGGSTTAGPTFTLNGLNATVPVLTCGGSDVLTSVGTTNAVTRPYTIAAAAKRTSTGGALFQDGAGTNLFHDGGANLLRLHSSSGTQTASATDGTWFAVAGTVPTTTSLIAYVNGAASSSGSVTTGDTASSAWKLCNGFMGALTELYLINGTAASGAQLNTLSTVQRAIGGY